MEDSDKKICIVVYKGYEDGLNILQQDPNYSFLNETKLDKDKVLSLIRERVTLLQQHWDSPQSVFDSNPQLESPPKLLS